MELWPAIDIRGGRCVRLVQGRFSDETVYGDPLEQAKAFVAAGATRLHVVDLDAARDGDSANRDVVAGITSAVQVPVQVGGGIRDLAAAAGLLDAGVARVVVGTVAVEQPGLLARMVERWPGRVLVGLDHRNVAAPDGAARREVSVRGWLSHTNRGLDAALEALGALELGGVVVTDIERDGTESGPDLSGLEHVLALTTLRVVASGGVATVSDLGALCRLQASGRRLTGVIVGRALLSGAISIPEAVSACAP